MLCALTVLVVLVVCPAAALAQPLSGQPPAQPPPEEPATEAERLEDREKRLFLREAWVRLQTPDAGIRFNVGKLDVTHYFDRNFFAEDETRQFLNASLVGSPMLRPPPNGPGAAIRVSQADWRYALGVHAPDDFGGDMSGLPYIVAELGRRDLLALAGHSGRWAR